MSSKHLLIYIIVFSFILIGCSNGNNENNLIFGKGHKIALQEDEKEVERSKDLVELHQNNFIPASIQLPVNKIFKSNDNYIYVLLSLTKDVSAFVNAFKADPNFEVTSDTKDKINDFEFSTIIVEKKEMTAVLSAFSNLSKENIFVISSIFYDKKNAEQFFEKRKNILSRVHEE